MGGYRSRLIWVLLALASPLSAKAQTEERGFLSRGLMIGVTMEGAPGYHIDHTVPVSRWVDTGTSLDLVETDSTYRVEGGVGALLGIRVGYGFTPWLTPFINFSLGRGKEKYVENRVANIMYSEFGARLNLAIPNSPIVPYATGAFAYRSLSHQRKVQSGRTTIVYLGTEQTFSGWASTLGGGVYIALRNEGGQRSGLDISFQVTNGQPIQENDYGLYSRTTTKRFSVGWSAYLGGG